MGGLIEGVANLVSKAADSSIGRKTIQSGARALENGSWASQMLEPLIRSGKQAMSAAENAVDSAVSDSFKTVVKKGGHQNPEYLQYFINGAVPKDPEVAAAAITHRNAMMDLQRDFQKAGAKTAPLVQGPYFPREYQQDALRGASREKMIQHLVSTGQAPNEARASQMLGIQRGVEPPITAPFHHIESPRTAQLPKAAMREDVGVIYDYLTRGAKRLAEIQTFGQKGEKLEQVLSAIRKEDGEAQYQFARGIVSSELGHNPAEHIGDVEKAMNVFESATKLGLAPISHLGQPLNNVITMGARNFLKGTLSVIKDPEEATEFARNIGIPSFKTLQEMRKLTRGENTGLLAQLGKISPSKNLGRTIDGLRILSANVGRAAAESEFDKVLANPGNTLAGRLARQRLNVLGINVPDAVQRGALAPEDLAKAAYTLSRVTTYEHGALDLPPAWRQSVTGRTLTQYKSFYFTQSKFIKDQVLMPALRGEDLRPLTYLAILFPSFGEVVADAKYIVRGKDLKERPDWKKYPGDRIIDNMVAAGTFGIITDITNAMNSGTPEMAYRFLAGPKISDVVDYGRLPFGTWRRAKQEALRTVPIFGNMLANKLVPPERHVPGTLESGTVTKTLKKIQKSL